MPRIYIGHLKGSFQFRIESVLDKIKEDNVEKADLKQAWLLLRTVSDHLEKLLLENSR